MGDGVEVANTIAVKNHVSHPEVLDRETKGIKFDRTTIIASKLAKVMNDGRDDKNIVQDEIR